MCKDLRPREAAVSAQPTILKQKLKQLFVNFIRYLLNDSGDKLFLCK